MKRFGSDQPSHGGCPMGYGGGDCPRPPALKGRWPLHNTMQILRDPWGSFNRAYKTLGPAFRIKVLGTEAAVLSGPSVRELFSEAGDDYLERAFFYEPLEKALKANELIFRAEGERHRELRRMVALSHSRHIAAAHVPATAAEIVLSLEEMEPGQKYDSLEMMGEMLLAACGPMVADENLRPYATDLFHYGSVVMDVAGSTGTRAKMWMPRFRRAAARVESVTERVLRRWRDGEIESQDNLISCLGEARDDHGQPLPDVEIAALARLNMLGFGVYLSRVVAFMLFELLKDPKLVEECREEIDAAFADGYTYDALVGLTVIRSVYLEALRRYPIWHLIPFRAERDFVFEGRRISEGEILLLSSVQEHFIDEFYPNPHGFDHTRCMAPREEHRQRGAFAPFGLGARRCVAAGQVEVVSLLSIAVMLHRGEFSSDPNYVLKARMKPLPAPHGFDIQFGGLRTPTPPEATSPPRTQGESVDDLGARLEEEERDRLEAAIDKEMDVCVFDAGVTVFEQGATADAFYVIESGQVDVIQAMDDGRSTTLTTLGPGDIFGETGLLHGRPRNATIRVGPDHQLVALQCSAEVYREMLSTMNLIGEELIALVRRRKLATVMGRLGGVADRETIRQLIADADLKYGVEGDVFISEGEPATTFHTIERGEFEVVRRTPGGGERILAKLGPGQFFGEVGLLRDAPRNATVRVAAGCQSAETVVIGRDAFATLVEPGSGLRERVYQAFAARETTA